MVQLPVVAAPANGCVDPAACAADINELVDSASAAAMPIAEIRMIGFLQ
jgi:hypothetical protein